MTIRKRDIYKKLKRFRAGIEGNISMLKRVFGLDRCTWRELRLSCSEKYP